MNTIPKELKNKEAYLHPKVMVYAVFPELYLAVSPTETIDDDSEEHSWT